MIEWMKSDSTDSTKLKYATLAMCIVSIEFFDTEWHMHHTHHVPSYTRKAKKFQKYRPIANHQLHQDTLWPHDIQQWSNPPSPQYEACFSNCSSWKTTSCGWQLHLAVRRTYTFCGASWSTNIPYLRYNKRCSKIIPNLWYEALHPR